MLLLSPLLIIAGLIQLSWACQCRKQLWAEMLADHEFALNVTVKSRPVEFELDEGFFRRYTISILETFKLPEEDRADQIKEIYLRSGPTSCAIEVLQPETIAMFFGHLGSSKEPGNDSFFLVDFCGVDKLIKPEKFIINEVDQLEREHIDNNEVNADIKIIMSRPLPDYEWELLKPTHLASEQGQLLGQFDDRNEFADAQKTIRSGQRSQAIVARPPDDEDYDREPLQEGSGNEMPVADSNPEIKSENKFSIIIESDKNEILRPQFEQSAMSSEQQTDDERNNSNNLITLNCSLLFIIITMFAAVGN